MTCTERRNPVDTVSLMESQCCSLEVWSQNDSKNKDFPPSHSVHRKRCALRWNLLLCPLTKVMKPVIAPLRSLGMRILFYLDDIIIFSRSGEESHRDTSYAINLLKSLGFIVNLEKSNMTPSQTLTYLGFHVDSASMMISLPVLSPLISPTSYPLCPLSVIHIHVTLCLPCLFLSLSICL